MMVLQDRLDLLVVLVYLACLVFLQDLTAPLDNPILVFRAVLQFQGVLLCLGNLKYA